MALTKVSTPAIKDEAITLAKLLHGDSNSNGKFLRANNGADPTFESVITDLVNDTTPQLGGDLASNGNDIDFADGDKAVFGTGNDMNIFHSADINQITTGNKVFKIFGGGSNNKTIFATATTNAAELYFDNSKKLETRSGGLGVLGHIEAGDSNKLMLGDSNDLQIYHESNISTIKDNYGDLRILSNTLRLQPLVGNENFLYAIEGGTTRLFYDGAAKFETISNGVIIDNTCRIENINNKVASMVNACLLYTSDAADD